MQGAIRCFLFALSKIFLFRKIYSASSLFLLAAFNSANAGPVVYHGIYSSLDEARAACVLQVWAGGPANPQIIQNICSTGPDISQRFPISAIYALQTDETGDYIAVGNIYNSLRTSHVWAYYGSFCQEPAVPNPTTTSAQNACMVACPATRLFDLQIRACSPEVAAAETEECKTCNPINFSTGDKYWVETDYIARTTLLVGNPTPIATYAYNALGQRVRKTDEATDTTIHFIYDPQGRLIAEIDAATGDTMREYIYVNGQQVALVDDTDTPNEALYFVHNDHLGTPQKITDDSKQVVWAADYEPFGRSDITLNTISNDIALPGQYSDVESGLHYNYFRDYDPSIGRYIESDPIGIGGGLNTYAYVGSNPIAYVDEDGRQRRAARNSRVTRQQNRVLALRKSLQDRLENLRKQSEQTDQTLKDAADLLEAIEQARKQLLPFPQKCSQMMCPWDPPSEKSLNPSSWPQMCPATDNLQQVSPMRTAENGCRCVQYSPDLSQ